MDRRLALARGENLPDRASGAALFADISGFTVLTDTLVQELGRKQGTEEITRHLDRVYTALIAHVHAWRGSVVHFSGDAITCWFGAAAENDASFSAVAAALAMQRDMVNFADVYSPAGQHIPFALRVAVVAGTVRRLVVGDPAEQQLDVLAGGLLAELAEAKGCADIGEVVVSAGVVQQLDEALHISGRRPGKSRECFAVVESLDESHQPVANPWPADPGLPLAIVAPWLPPAVYRRIHQLQSGQGQFLAELRPAAALFLKFADLDYDGSAEAGEQLDQYVRWVQAIAARYEGTLLDVIIGEKGSYLYLAFGPLAAHDDDAARAVAAAVDLQNPPAGLAFAGRPKIGLAWGQIRAGAYGSPRRLVYGALGNAVNLAARLMEQVPAGDSWCDGALYQAARRQWRFDSLPPVAVKGRPEAVPVYRPVGRVASLLRPGLIRPGKIAGRQAEVTRLVAALDDSSDGMGRVLLIEGEAGIGKSRLVQEFLAMVQEWSMTAFVGAGQSIEQHTPYRAWRDILNSLFGLDSLPPMADSAAERQKKVIAFTQSHAPDELSRLPLLNELLSLALPETERTAGLDPALRQQNLIALVLALLRAWPGRPLILVLEDAHWLDSLSWELAVQVERGLRAAGVTLLMVLALRPVDENSRAGQQLLLLKRLGQSFTLGQTITIRLSLLPAEAIAALVADRLALVEGGLPADLAAFIGRRAEGNPFFAEELLLALQEQEVIALQPAGSGPLNHCVVTGDLAEAGQRLPDTLQGLILARIDRLPPERQVVLKVAAVIGRTFSYDLLHHVLNQYRPLAPAGLDEHLAALLQQDLAHLELPAPDLSYIFKHIITQEVAYQTLLFAQRRQLHHLVADWYEQKAGRETAESGLTPYLPLLVHHYHKAADMEQERRYARLAAEQAIAQYAHAEAITYLTRLLALTPETEPAERYALLLLREAAYHMQGNRAAQAADLDLLVTLSQALADPRWQSEVALRRARYAEAIGDYGAAVRATQNAINLAQESAAVSLVAQGHYEWGVALMRQSEYEAAWNQLETALDYSRAAALPQIEAHCLRMLGVVCSYRGQYEASLPYYEQAHRLYCQVNDRQGESRVLSNLGSSTRYLGDPVAARTYSEQALAISRELGDRKWEGTLLNNLGLDWLDIGDHQSAQSYFGQALQIGREVGVPTVMLLALVNLSGAYARQDQYDAALEYAQQALEIAQELNAPQDAAIAWHALGEAYLGQGQWPKAERAFSQAAHLRQEIGQSAVEMESRAALAVALLALGETVAARQQTDIVLAFLTQGDFSGAEEPILVYLRCYKVLVAVADNRVEPVLHQAARLLQEKAGRISDEATRRSFLDNISAHREIIALAAAFPFALKGRG